MSEEFLLKWNDHHSSFFSILHDLCSSETLTDVTLSCGGRLFEAHKIMLCVSSSFFRSILAKPTRPDRATQHPIVFLKDIQPKQLEQLLQYMYHGEINVLQDDLTPLIEAARSLQVKGLSEASTGTNSLPPAPKQNRLTNLLNHPPPMIKKGRMNHYNNHGSAPAPKRKLESPNSTQPKSVLLSNALTGGGPAAFMLPTEPDPPETLKEESWMSNQASDQDISQSGGSDYDTYGEQMDEEPFYQQQSQMNMGAVAAAAAAAAAASSKQRNSNNLGVNNATSESRLRYHCDECGKGFITPSKLQRHSYSHTGLRPFHCEICSKSFSQSANLKTHIRNTHPEVVGTPAETMAMKYDDSNGGENFNNATGNVAAAASSASPPTSQ